MSRLVVASALVALLGAVGFAQMPPPDWKVAKDARETALRAGDEQGWGRYTTEGFLNTNGDGVVVTRAQRMAAIKGNKVTTPPAKTSDVNARTYGDTVILTWRSEGTAGPVRFAEVWVKQNGQWKVALVTSARVAKP